MIQLRLLGGLDLRDAEGRELHSILAQPKRTALLAYLALAAPGYQRRDQLIAVFWPESETDRARKALRQATFFLRRSLGPDAILSRGDDELALNAEAVTSDVAEFEERIEQNRLGDAIGMYGGELLPGFHADGVPEFDRFIDTQRSRLHRLAIDAGGKRVAELVAAGRPDEALLCARWSVSLAPADTEPVGRLLELLEDAGDRTGALQAFDEYARRLATDYELPPDARLEARVARLRAQAATPPASTSSASTETADTERSGPRAGTSAPAAGADSPSSVARPALSPWFPLAWLAGAVAIAVVAIQLRGPRTVPGEETIAVFPFRVASADTSLAYLGEGFADLIAYAFTGETGPRALDMRVTVRAIGGTGQAPSETTRGSARRLGSRTLVDGSVVETPAGIIVQASLIETSTGRNLGTVQEEAPVDSFAAIAHRLAAALMGHATGQEERLLTTFLDAPFAVIRAYVKGQAAFRHGDYYLAELELNEAVRLDPTFAPAAFGLLQATGWAGPTGFGPPARRLAWDTRDRLPDRERDYVEAMLGGPPGDRFSGVTDPARAIERWHAYVERWNDRPDGWYELGDRYLHGGAMAGFPDFLERAETAFRTALQVDPAYAPAYLHLVDVLVEKDVTPGLPSAAPGRWHEELRTRADHYFVELAPDARYTTGEAWRAAMALGDEPWLRQIRERMDSMERYELQQIVNTTVAYGWDQADAWHAIEILERTAITRNSLRAAIAEHAYLDLNAGRPARANLAADEMRRRFPEEATHLFMRVEAALLGEGDTVAAEAAARELERLAAAPEALDLVRRHDQYLAAFLSETWKLMHGESSDTRAAMDRIRKGLVVDTAAAVLRPLGDFYTAYLDALLAVKERKPEALTKALLADSVLQRHWGESANQWTVWWVLENSGPVLIMRLHELRNDDERVLAAARRRGVLHTTSVGTRFLTTRLLVEARLAARAGDTRGARRAYTHYLALRPDPEPQLRPLRRQVQAELDALPGN